VGGKVSKNSVHKNCIFVAMQVRDDVAMKIGSRRQKGARFKRIEGKGISRLDD
jgi:hypothetical protein